MKTKWLVGLLILAVLISGCTQVPPAPQPTTTQPTLTKKIETKTPISTPTIPPKIWHVPGDYPKVDAAIIAASPGDSIEVAPGNYPGFIVDKPLSIRGSGVNITIIKGKVDVQAIEASISNFTILGETQVKSDNTKVFGNAINILEEYSAHGIGIDGSGNEVYGNTIEAYYGISLSGKNNKISDNIIKTSHWSDAVGIAFGPAEDNMVLGNTIDATTGIDLWSGNHNEISNNDITASKDGIYVSSNSIRNSIISNNNIKAYRNGIDISYYSEGNKVAYNNIVSENNGIYIYGHVKNNTILGNIITAKASGVDAELLEDIIISANTIKNAKIGIFLHYDTSTIEVFGNNFIDNMEQAEDDGSNNLWYKDGKGNYWNDWKTPDNDNDGIVDKPRVVSGKARNVDRYPLSVPYAK